MFSFFRKKQKQNQKQPESTISLTPKNQYTQEYEMNPELYAEGVAKVQFIFGKKYAESLTKSEIIRLLVNLRLAQNNQTATQQQEEEKRYQKELKATQRFLKQRENEEAAQRFAQQAKQEAFLKQEQLRNQRLNNLTRKHGYKRKQNLINNVARQRGSWRGRNPNANYLSIENFANSKFFHPHSIYTGISNNNDNASTLTLNSPRSVSSNRPYSPFGGKRSNKTRKH